MKYKGVFSLILLSFFIFCFPFFAFGRPEIEKIVHEYCAADTLEDLILARSCITLNKKKELQEMYDSGRIFNLPRNVEVEIVEHDEKMLACRIGIPGSGKYYWTDIEALHPGYRQQQKEQQDKLQTIAIRWARIFIQNHYREELPIAEHRCIVEKVEGENIWAVGFPSLGYEGYGGNKIYVICIRYKGNNEWDILKGPYIEYAD